MKLSIGIVVLIAAAVGYLLGTENGRAQRDVIMVKLGRGGDDDMADAVSDAVTDAADAASDAVS